MDMKIMSDLELPSPGDLVFAALRLGQGRSQSSVCRRPVPCAPSNSSPRQRSSTSPSRRSPGRGSTTAMCERQNVGLSL